MKKVNIFQKCLFTFYYENENKIVPNFLFFNNYAPPVIDENLVIYFCHPSYLTGIAQYIFPMPKILYCQAFTNLRIARCDGVLYLSKIEIGKAPHLVIAAIWLLP